MNALERFMSYVEKTDDCWLWTGACSSGYGRFKVGETSHRAHRWSYEAFVGPIPEGLILDHLCHGRDPVGCVSTGECMHRRCVNPAHLEPVTQQQNVDRGALAATQTRRHRSRTHCRRDHEFTAENTYMFRGQRFCRACRAAEWQRRKARAA